MKAKVLLWSVVSILIVGIAAAAIWWLRRPQVIIFSDDSKVTLLGVDYGKKHTPPTVTASAAGSARRGGSFTTTNDTLVLWIRQQFDSKQWHNFQYCAYDKANTACVQTYGRNSNGRRGNEVVAVQFDAFPRRQGKFIVRVEEQGNGFQEMSEQKFVIANPARGSFAKWTAEPLPATKDDDDLSVTLTKLTAGADTTYQRNQDNPDDPVNKGVQVVFQVQRSGKTVNNWQPVAVETSDATGNQFKVNSVGQNNWQNGWANNDWQNDEDTFTYQYGLWPDEPAWKMRVEFSQQSDFADSEMWKVQDLPVLPGRQQEMYNNGGTRRTGPGGAPVAETDLNGIHLKLFPAKEFTDAGQNNWMQGGLFIEASPAVGDGWRMAVKVTDAQANEVQSSEYNTSQNNDISSIRYRLQDISGLTNLNVSIALHKSRFVEFTVKPATAAITKNQ